MAVPRNEPTIESHLVYQGRILNLRVDTVQLPRGTPGVREIVEHSEVVCTVPLDDENNVILVRQFRKAVEESLLEIPAGGIEEGEAPEEAVVRELQEEIGYTADSLRHLSTFWTTPGFCNELMHSYLATELRPDSRRPDEDENIQVVRVPMDRIPGMIRGGEIKDVKSIASLLLVLYLHNQSGDRL